MSVLFLAFLAFFIFTAKYRCSCGVLFCEKRMFVENNKHDHDMIHILNEKLKNCVSGDDYKDIIDMIYDTEMTYPEKNDVIFKNDKFYNIIYNKFLEYRELYKYEEIQYISECLYKIAEKRGFDTNKYTKNYVVDDDIILFTNKQE